MSFGGGGSASLGGGTSPPAGIGHRPPLFSRWEYAVAVHEAGHMVAGHALGFRVGETWITPIGTVAGDRRGSAECFLALRELMTVEEVFQRRVVVLLAGTVAQAVAMGCDYDFLEYGEATMEACQYRAARRRRPAPRPASRDDLQAHDWDTAPDDDHAAAVIWMHSGRGSDLSEALETVEQAVAVIADMQDRDLIRVNLWSRSQREAVRLCRERVEEIRALARLICLRGGHLTAAEVEAFFADPPAIS